MLGLLYIGLLHVHRCVALPIGRLYNVSEKLPKPLELNSLLEDAFKKNKRFLPDRKEVEVAFSVKLLFVIRFVKF